MPPTVEALDLRQLPEVPASAVDALNLLLRPCAPLPWEWSGTPMQLSFAAAVPVSADALCLPFTCADLPGSLYLDADGVGLLAPELASAIQAADPAQRSVLFEFAMLEALAPLESALAGSVRFHDQPAAAQAVAVTLRAGSQDLNLQLSPELLRRLADRWASSTKEHATDFPRLSLPVVLQGGWQRLAPADLTELVIGAVVMLEPGMRLIINGQHSAQVDAHGANAVQMLGDLEFDSSLRTSDMPTTPSQSPLDQTTLTLVCEVGRWQLPLAELRTLAAGSVLGVPGGQGNAVQLCVDGQAIGSGELVRIGEGLGVRVTSLDHHE